MGILGFGQTVVYGTGAVSCRPCFAAGRLQGPRKATGLHAYLWSTVLRVEIIELTQKSPKRLFSSGPNIVHSRNEVCLYLGTAFVKPLPRFRRGVRVCVRSFAGTLLIAQAV